MKTKRGLSLFVLITFGTMLLFHSMGQERRNQKTIVVEEDVRELLEEEKRKEEEREYKGNYIGYSLYSGQVSHRYKRDFPYLVEEDYVGKGVFLSEYVSESEVFLGRVLQQIIKGRGKLDDEGSSYFTPYAKRQMKEADWELLEEDWVWPPL